MIALATLLSALTVSMAGMIGWVGLLVPHLARPLVGAANARVLPLCALMGAILLVLADDIYEHIRYEGLDNPHILALEPALNDRTLVVTVCRKPTP